MNNWIVFFNLFLVSVILGFIKYGSLSESYKNATWQLKFIEYWNDFFNFFIAGLIGYYFITIRWPLLQDGQNPNTGDFVLFIIFLLGLFGHLCVMSKNITDGVEAVFKRFFGR